MCVPNAALCWVVIGAVVFLGLVLYVPVLRDLFRFALLHPMDLAMCLTAALMSLFWCEALKITRRHQTVRASRG
jgi:Ca2+-transporting ATPase